MLARVMTAMGWWWFDKAGSAPLGTHGVVLKTLPPSSSGLSPWQVDPQSSSLARIPRSAWLIRSSHLFLSSFAVPVPRDHPPLDLLRIPVWLVGRDHHHRPQVVRSSSVRFQADPHGLYVPRFRPGSGLGKMGKSGLPSQPSPLDRLCFHRFAPLLTFPRDIDSLAGWSETSS